MVDVKLYLGDCLDVLPTLSDKSVDAVITDPPWGINLATNYKGRKRGALAECNNFLSIVGDDKPFDPRPFFGFPVVILFGANYYPRHLPPSGGWIVWDKLDGLKSKREIGFNDNSDCELIWTNVGNSARIIRHRWMGCMKASEHGQRRVHPTQKPVALMKILIEHWTQPGDTVADFYMGSGSTGVACVQTNRNFIGCEIAKYYFDIAQQRIAKAQAEMVQLRLTV